MLAADGAVFDAPKILRPQGKRDHRGRQAGVEIVHDDLEQFGLHAGRETPRQIFRRPSNRYLGGRREKINQAVPFLTKIRFELFGNGFCLKNGIDDFLHQFSGKILSKHNVVVA